MPRTWQQRMIEFCGPTSAEELHRYWDEVAAETVYSAGKVNSDTRKFLVEPGYRSSYLDGLAARANFAEPPYRSPPLVRCLYEYLRKAQNDRAFTENETAFYERLKEQEIAKLAIAPVGPMERKRDILPFVQKFSTGRGFVAQRSGFVRTSGSGLLFQITADLGGRPQLGARLPLQFYIHHESDPSFFFDATFFDRIVPGFWRYGYCPNPASCVLGILAHVEMFDILFSSIDAG